MEAILFGGIGVLGACLAVYYFLKLKQVETTAADLKVEHEKNSLALGEEKKKNTVLETQLDLLQQQRAEELQRKEKSEVALKEQLELMGKELILRGSQVIRSENQSQLSQFLLPFKEKLDTFEKEVKANNQRETERFVNMQTIIKGLSEQHFQMNTTAQNLADALRGSQKMQGDWGEMALERILETSGLQKGIEYDTQTTFKDENGNFLRPDVVINLPENKHIIIDSKVSMVAYERLINSEKEGEHLEHMAAHILSIKTHIKQLSDKNYSYLKGVDTPEFVLMFIPLESSFALAIKEEPALYQLAWEKRVVLVTPSTLLATLKTVESIWKQERQNRYALDIAEQAGKLYDKFHGFLGNLETLGKKQQDAHQAFEDAMKKLSTGPGNLIGSTEKLVKLGARAKKQIDSKYLDSGDDEA